MTHRLWSQLQCSPSNEALPHAPAAWGRLSRQARSQPPSAVTRGRPPLHRQRMHRRWRCRRACSPRTNGFRPQRCAAQQSPSCPRAPAPATTAIGCSPPAAWAPPLPCARAVCRPRLRAPSQQAHAAPRRHPTTTAATTSQRAAPPRAGVPHQHTPTSRLAAGVKPGRVKQGSEHQRFEGGGPEGTPGRPVARRAPRARAAHRRLARAV